MATVAVIGSGISGSAAAWALHQFSDHDVVLYEARARPGGHSATVDIVDGDRTVPVDTGFIVFNEQAYPELTSLFRHLEVQTERSDMSLGISVGDGRLEWSGDTPNAIFAQRRNLVSLRFWRMLLGILRFNRRALADLRAGKLDEVTLGAYLRREGYPEGFVEDYLVPMGAAIWSTPDAEMMDFPAARFVGFFANHRLLQIRPPNWRTVTGGSRRYVEKLLAPLGDRVLLERPVTRIKRDGARVLVSDGSGETRSFDQVILACHSDQALGILDDATDAEVSVLTAVRYRPNEVVLHRDASLMPRNRKVWSAWNYLSQVRRGTGRTEISVTYWMNRLQNLETERPVLVSLNPLRPPAPETVLFRTQYNHPQFDTAAHDAQRGLADLQGRNAIWFAGAWTGHGFHEDGLRSGLDAAQALGAVVPWRANTPVKACVVAASV